MGKATSNSRKLLVALVLLLAALSVDAHAYNDDDDKPQLTDRTAYTVPKGMHKIGVFSVEYGLTDDLQMITWQFWWHILAPNGGLEWRFIKTPLYSMSASITGLYVTTRPLTLIFEDLPIADLGIVPVDLIGTWRLGKESNWSLTWGNELTPVFLAGTFDDEAFQGAVNLTNLQSHATLEWRVSRVVALQLHGRYLVFQNARAATEIETKPDDFTTIRAGAVVKSDIFDFPHAFQLVPQVHLSWETFNLVLGLGYGNYIIPAINFYLPTRGVVPKIDLYWRF
jgi:hypothetical protein